MGLTATIDKNGIQDYLGGTGAGEALDSGQMVIRRGFFECPRSFVSEFKSVAREKGRMKGKATAISALLAAAVIFTMALAPATPTTLAVVKFRQNLQGIHRQYPHPRASMGLW